MNITYRLSTPADEAALIRFWSEESGWDQLDAATWNHRLGKAVIALGLDSETGEIVSQFAFFRVLICINGREVAALRPFAAIISKRARSFHSPNPLNHPIPAMYRLAVNAMRERGYGLVYMIPDPRWARLFRIFPRIYTGSFPLWSLPLPLAQSLPLPAGFVVTELTTLDERIDPLWQQMAQRPGCLTVRDSRTLPWKTSHGSYRFLGVEQHGEFVGLATSMHRPQDKQWMICDLLTTGSETVLQATLTAVINLAHEQALIACVEAPLNKVAVLMTPHLEPALKALGFAQDNYKFSLVVDVLDKSIAKEDILPAQWYVSAND